MGGLCAFWLFPYLLHQPTTANATRERAKAEAAVEDAQAKLAELEEQLDIAGGDAAATRQAMRALEAATQEMGEEVS